MFTNLEKLYYKTTNAKYNFWWGKSGTLVGQFFSTAGTNAASVKQLKMPNKQRL